MARFVSGDGAFRDSFAATLVYAHHKGLPNFKAEGARQSLAFREDENVPGRPESTCALNDARLGKFLERHHQALASESLQSPSLSPAKQARSPRE